ncbi:type I-B CRISPR-associated protein Cas5b [Paludifilum halophilum]|uniref:Type I-B CRISPR-associated protein Cas5 n=1 Tax=Paludifilum halophilum TaxID=1642702 RepID=A0A235B546_9BACL|nr:type I-B CRISPR-associated protein Cas5b [Paludifilum halophilum]OYD07426.1 type I-B CRISPR-associated protein Cas5 [Paludifilum halophilum]
MKTLRLKLFQETACYKKPLAFKVGETYPLPPYSTVKGWAHALLDADRFIPMRVSVQGRYETKLVDYQTHYLFKKRDVAEFPLVLNGLGIESYNYQKINKMPLYTHLLYGVELLLHIEAEENILRELQERIERAEEHFSLGRWEDLARVDECRLTEVGELEDEKTLPMNAYVPRRSVMHKRHIPYQLNWKYDIHNGVRRWQKISVGYVLAGLSLMPGQGLVDDKGDPVVFHDQLEQ